MNREIKFRAKTLAYKEEDYEYKRRWVYGFYHSDNNGVNYIIEDKKGGRMYPGVNVVRETVGQFTGLTDKNGVEIYEGDILVDFYYDELPIIIQFIGGCFVGIQDTKEIKNRNWLSFKIIGNITEHKHLLK